MHDQDIHGILHSISHSSYYSDISELCTNSYDESHLTDSDQYIWAVVYDSSG